ncbi:FAD binding domain-containing protein [Vacuolonema iberomarrocanum]|uniref:FAD binding domain-containing protein n=1 Tax=Vacuolonema iberomarrocanum TaxID=3454632 RepID=UPI0019E04611|nr:xanthine dehydrogenase family protein subunit M [filamentous cyanobacterium LEGE 07170]
MKNFTYGRASSVEEVIEQANRDRNAMYIAGGTNLVDRMKAFLDEPSQLLDISRLEMQSIERTQDGGLRIDALVTNTDLANNANVRRDYPLLSRAILAGASQQIRNMATVGGNLMQRTRCAYYYDTAFACNKRQPGTGCPAINGINRIHAILGASDRCVAVNPSDMSVALAALDATVEVQGEQGQRDIPFVDFHRLPGDTPERDTNLEPGELITAVVLPPMAFAQSGVYLKLRDRASYAFALVSVAAAVELSGDQISTARIALGGVAHKPWRASEAEAFLQGQTPNQSTFEQAADIALQEAQPLAYNAFKVDLSRRAIRRALAVSSRGGGIA